MFTAHSPRVEREARERSKKLREWGGGIVTYIAPEITANSQRDTGFGWPLQGVILPVSTSLLPDTYVL